MNEDLKKECEKLVKWHSKTHVGTPMLSCPRCISLEYIRTNIQTSISKAREEGAKEAYLMFLKEIKSAKNKFPNRNEFELVVDVRDIEKSIKFLTQDNEKEGSSGYDDFGNPIKINLS